MGKQSNSKKVSMIFEFKFMGWMLRLTNDTPNAKANFIRNQNQTEYVLVYLLASQLNADTKSHANNSRSKYFY